MAGELGRELNLDVNDVFDVLFFPIDDEEGDLLIGDHDSTLALSSGDVLFFGCFYFCYWWRC